VGTAIGISLQMFLTTPTGARFQGASPPICKLFILAYRPSSGSSLPWWYGKDGRDEVLR